MSGIITVKAGKMFLVVGYEFILISPKLLPDKLIVHE